MTKSPEQQQQAAARELDRMVEARTLELSVLSSHLQSLAEKEKSDQFLYCGCSG